MLAALPRCGGYTASSAGGLDAAAAFVSALPRPAHICIFSAGAAAPAQRQLCSVHASAGSASAIFGTEISWAALSATAPCTSLLGSKPEQQQLRAGHSCRQRLLQQFRSFSTGGSSRTKSSNEGANGSHRQQADRDSHSDQPAAGPSRRKGPMDPGAARAKARRIAPLVGIAAGAFGSLVGVGGGVLIVPAIVSACPGISQR